MKENIKILYISYKAKIAKMIMKNIVEIESISKRLKFNIKK